MIIQGNSYRIPLADNSVHCVISSFPYFGLRDYGLPKTVWGGDVDCQHIWESVIKHRSTGGPQVPDNKWSGTSVDEAQRDTESQFCQICGAWRGCFGLEPTIALHVQNAVAVCREIKRVLRPDGVFFLNYGDSYATSKNGRSAADTKAVGKDDRTFRDKPFSITELPGKNLCGIPWRVALALQDDGWILRADIIWSKLNPMPESVTDRPTRAHEYIFMLTKEPGYFYDAEAVREKVDKPVRLAASFRDGGIYTNNRSFDNSGSREKKTHGDQSPSMEGRNKRSVWELATEPYPAAHYATFPTKLVEPMILAGTSARGVCPICGSPWQRIIKKVGESAPVESRKGRVGHNGTPPQQSGYFWNGPTTKGTDYWEPTCRCDYPPIPAIVLDPFCGSGTVGEVARNLGRRFIGIDLSAKYLQENALPRAEYKTSQAVIETLPLFATIGT